MNEEVVVTHEYRVWEDILQNFFPSKKECKRKLAENSVWFWTEEGKYLLSPEDLQRTLRYLPGPFTSLANIQGWWVMWKGDSYSTIAVGEVNGLTLRLSRKECVRLCPIENELQKEVER